MAYDSKILSLHLFLILRAFSRCSCRGRCRFLRKRLESLRGCTKEQEDKEAIRCGQQFHIPLKSLSKRQLSILVAGQGTTLGCAVEGCVAAKNDRQTFPARALLHDPNGRGVDSDLASGTADLLGTNESKTTCDFNGNFALCPPRN